MEHIHPKGGGCKPAQFSGKPLGSDGAHISEEGEDGGGIENAEGSEIAFEVGVHIPKLYRHEPGAEEMHAESCNAEDIDPGSLCPRERMPVQPPAYEDKEHEAAYSLNSEGKVPFDTAKLGGEGQKRIYEETSCNTVAEDRLPAFIGNSGENRDGEVDGK